MLRHVQPWLIFNNFQSPIDFFRTTQWIPPWLPDRIFRILKIQINKLNYIIENIIKPKKMKLSFLPVLRSSRLKRGVLNSMGLVLSYNHTLWIWNFPSWVFRRSKLGILWVHIFVLEVFRGSKYFSRGYFVGNY